MRRDKTRCCYFSWRDRDIKVHIVLIPVVQLGLFFRFITSESVNVIINYTLAMSNSTHIAQVYQSTWVCSMYYSFWAQYINGQDRDETKTLASLAETRHWYVSRPSCGRKRDHVSALTSFFLWQIWSAGYIADRLWFLCSVDPSHFQLFLPEMDGEISIPLNQRSRQITD